MAQIRPFRAIRARADIAGDIAAPPYDVLDRDEVLALLDRRPQNFIRVTRSDALLDVDLDGKDQRIYDKGRDVLKEMQQSGHLVRDEKPAVYLYEQTMGSHRQVGLVAGVSSAEYFDGKIKKHEHTRNRDLDSRIRHIETLGVHAGPVFLTYYARPEVDQLVAALMEGPPEVDFVADDQVRHRLWVVDEASDVEALQGVFAEIPALYIADGHHRTEAGSQVARRKAAANPDHRGDEPYNDVMAVIFPHDQVKILAYNRVVFDLGSHSPESLLDALAKDFIVAHTDQPEPQAPAHFGMYLRGAWYSLQAKAGSYDPTDHQQSLDVAILQRNVLAPLLGIDDPKASDRIAFVGGIHGAEGLKERADATSGVAFYCYPTQMAQVMAISDRGEVMPPKSTWFEPKLRSGLVSRVIDD